MVQLYARDRCQGLIRSHRIIKTLLQKYPLRVNYPLTLKKELCNKKIGVGGDQQKRGKFIGQQNGAGKRKSRAYYFNGTNNDKRQKEELMVNKEKRYKIAMLQRWTAEAITDKIMFALTGNKYYNKALEHANYMIEQLARELELL